MTRCKVWVDIWPVVHHLTPVIGSFRSRALKRFWERGQTQQVPPRAIDRVRRILSLLEAARAPDELDIPGLHFHPLVGGLTGRYAVTVYANHRITFGWDGEFAIEIDFEDYH